MTLAKWGMALQEMDLKLEYRPGKMKGRANALSRYPISLLALDCMDTRSPTLVTNMNGTGSETESKDGRTLSERQREDRNLAAIIDYQQKGVLPKEEMAARVLVLGASLYTMVDGVLYLVEGDKTLRLIPLAADRRQLFLEAHEGPFVGHLREAKIFGQLVRHY